MRTNLRLTQITMQVAKEALREGLARGVEINPVEVRRELKTRHDLILTLVCEELGISFQEITGE
jgi:hypothetical protein